MNTPSQPEYDAIITPPELEKFTQQLGLFQSVLRLIDDSEPAQTYVDDISAIFQPIYDGIDMVWARAIDRGRAAHAQKASVDQQSPNSNPSRQLQRISRNLIIGGVTTLKMMFRELADSDQSKFKSSFDRMEAMLGDASDELLSLTPVTPDEVARCAERHLHEGVEHLKLEDYGQARASFEQSARLLKMLDRMVM